MTVMAQETAPNLTIRKADTFIGVDGVLDEAVWDAIEPITGLHSPWGDQGKDATILKVFLTDCHFNFGFQVVDSTLTLFDYDDELTVAKEDRVELFFSKDSTLNEYHCIEIDPLGRVLDYSAAHYRKFDEAWDFQGVTVHARLTSIGYTVEGMIPLPTLKQLGIGKKHLLGVFRADYKSEKTDDVVWYSWIRPMSKDPDFHIPSAFGTVEHKNNK